MLETRLPPDSSRADSSRARRADIPARRAASRPASRGNTALDPALTPAREYVRPSAARPQSRLGRSEMRLMGFATTSTAIVCALLLLYLAAYAHVTQLGIEQAQARVQLHHNQVQNEMLQSERDRLESPQHVIAAATAQGMTPRGSTPVNYIRATPPGQAQEAGAQDGTQSAADRTLSADREQDTHGGTTADNNAAASFGH